MVESYFHPLPDSLITSTIRLPMSAATPRSTFYIPSGMVPVSAWMLTAFLLGPLSALYGIVYCASIVFIPMVKLRWVGSVGLGWAIGMTAVKVCRWGKVRSPVFTVASVVLGFLIAYYAAWGIHRTFLMDGQVRGPNAAIFVIQGFMPHEIINWGSLLFQQGNADAIAGLPLLAIWLVELVAIIYFTRAAFQAAWDDRPFCEACDQWNAPSEVLLHLPVSPVDPSWQSVREGWLDAIRKLKMKENDSETVAISLSSCPHCDRSHYLSASGLGWEASASGGVAFKEQKILRYMAVTATQINDLQQLGEQLEEAYQEMNQEVLESVSEPLPPESS